MSRCLDKLLPHKEALEVHLKNRMGRLFDLECKLLMYDVTSTFFEGRADFPSAQRGYSRGQRSDCNQVCIALVVSKCGMPLRYEGFAGNTADVTTVKHIVEMMESCYGKSDRIWVMNRSMVCEDNIEFLRDCGRRYIIGTPKAMLKKFEQDILKDDWHSIRDGLEVKFVTMPASDSDCIHNDATEFAADSRERYILCRNRERSKKEEGITQRFEKKIEDSLNRMKPRCEKQTRDPMTVERVIGRLRGQNTRTAKFVDVKMTKTDTGVARIEWSKIEAHRGWATVSAGCDLLRTNVADWSDEDLWKAYISCPKPRPPSASTRVTCHCVQSGIRKRIACWLTALCVVWRTHFGKPWANYAQKQA